MNADNALTASAPRSKKIRNVIFALVALEAMVLIPVLYHLAQS
jgi:hypothetical protein